VSARLRWRRPGACGGSSAGVAAPPSRHRLSPVAASSDHVASVDAISSRFLADRVDCAKAPAD
jgi:hypothetical protein